MDEQKKLTNEVGAPVADNDHSITFGARGPNHTHGIGHIIRLQRLGNGLLQHLGMQADYIGIIEFLLFVFRFLSRHWSSNLSEKQGSLL